MDLSGDTHATPRSQTSTLMSDPPLALNIMRLAEVNPYVLEQTSPIYLLNPGAWAREHHSLRLVSVLNHRRATAFYYSSFRGLGRFHLGLVAVWTFSEYAWSLLLVGLTPFA